jgi:hypothetical protein
LLSSYATLFGTSNEDIQAVPTLHNHNLRNQ